MTRDRVLLLAAAPLAGAVGGAAAVNPRLAVAAAIAAAAAAASLRWASRALNDPAWVLYPVALMSITLLRIPVLVHSNLVQVAVLLPFVTAIAFAGRWRAVPEQRVLVALFALSLLVAVELLRGVPSGAFQSLGGSLRTITQLGVALAFALSLFATARSTIEFRRRMTALALAPAFFVTTNIALHFLGIAQANLAELSIAVGEPAQLLGLIGIGATRTNFPLSPSINNFGSVCAIGLTISAVLVAHAKDIPRVIPMAGAAACIYGLMAGDSRTSLLVAAVVSLIAMIRPRWNLAKPVAIAAPLAPLLLIFVFSVVASNQLGETLSSSGRDVESGSGRAEIWHGVWEHLKQADPQDLVGYGAAGQVTSGASQNYKQLFGDVEHPERYPAHNAYLQQILDGGYIGLLVMISTLVIISGRLSLISRRYPGSAASALLAGLSTLLIAGFTEVTPSYYSMETLLYVLFIGSLAAFASNSTPAIAYDRHSFPADPVKPAPAPS